MKLYIGNLNYSVTDADLRSLFEPLGQVGSVELIMDKFTGRSKGFGFVEMPNSSEAKEAIEKLNDTDFKGRNVRVNEAQPRTERPARPPRRYPS